MILDADGRDDPIQPGLTIISQPYILKIPLTLIILMMPGFQEGQTHFCSLLGSIENHVNTGFFPKIL